METIELTGGGSAPKVCVEALDELERIWPGATFHNARPAIVVRVLEAYEKALKEEDGR